MSVIIHEALQNADYNLQNNLPFALGIAKNQLHNAVTLLDKGYDLYSTEVEPLIEKYGCIEDVPEIGN